MAILLLIITLTLVITLLALDKVHRDSTLRLARMSRVWQIGTKFNDDMNLNRLVYKIIEAAADEINAEVSILYLIDEVTDELYCEVALGQAVSDVTFPRVKLGAGIVGRVAESGEILNIANLSKDAKYKGYGLFPKRPGFVEKALLVIPVISEKKIIGVLEFVNKINGGPFTKDEEQLMELLVEMQIVNSIGKARLYQQLRETMVDSMRTLVSVIDAKDKYTIGHCQRVAEYAVLIGQHLGFQYEELEDLEFAAILHDIGKIGISDAILNKADRLTDEEYRLIKEHPLLGGEILQQISKLRPAIIAGAKYHHERYDGTGYCEGLKGEEIPLFARIISIADAYDAMVGDRVYRNGCSMENALQELKAGSGRQFDPYLVGVFACAMEHEIRSAIS